MQPSLPRFPYLVRFCRTGVLLLTLSALGAACDRHSAQEPPESYGHGSRHLIDANGHQIDYNDHQIDSRKNSNHFSDSQGVEEGAEKAGKSEGAEAAKANEKPAATPNPLGLGR